MTSCTTRRTRWWWTKRATRSWCGTWRSRRLSAERTRPAFSCTRPFAKCVSRQQMASVPSIATSREPLQTSARASTCAPLKATSTAPATVSSHTVALLIYEYPPNIRVQYRWYFTETSTFNPKSFTKVQKSNYR